MVYGRNLLVHPKDKVEMSEKCEVVYKIPCGSCEKVYIGETGRKLGIRIKKHRKDVEQHGKLNFTRAAKRESATEFNKSAIKQITSIKKITRLIGRG